MDFKTIPRADGFCFQLNLSQEFNLNARFHFGSQKQNKSKSTELLSFARNFKSSISDTRYL